MDQTLIDYFRCSDTVANFGVEGKLSEDPGFFKFGSDAVGFGQYSGGAPAEQSTNGLRDASLSTSVVGDQICLPFDFAQVINNLRMERYTKQLKEHSPPEPVGKSWRKLYYFLRPLLPVSVRKRFQKAYFQGWDKIAVPRWPLDSSVDTLMKGAMALILKSRQDEKVPFIWFWPEGAPSCAIMTHDVETLAGLEFCNGIMDCDSSLGIKSSFQLIPETRYATSEKTLNNFKARGHEVNVHDLNHDGALFQTKEEFLRRAAQINQYAKKFKSNGFRSGAMYRNQSWYDAFEFSYDMSVPNVAHLEPQRGGCCTVMPYFIGDILELPLTTIQDYTLFHILGDYSTNLWTHQMDLILEQNGLMSFITHPDYLKETRAREIYLELLTHLAKLRVDKNLWIALPGDVDRWWRNRNQMKLVRQGDRWEIEGPDSHRARVAYAKLVENRVVYTLNGAS